MMKKMQIDRFEEGFAVLVDDEMKTVDVPRAFFAFEVHEGDILEMEFEGDTPISAKFLQEETESAKARTKSLMEKLKRKKANR